MPDNDKTPLNKHHLHDKFFKKIYSDPRYAQDLLRLALFPEDYELFDIDKLIPSKEASIDPDTGTEKFCDLNFSVPFKKEPDSPVYFGVIFEHTTGNVTKAIEQLRGYCAREIARTNGFVIGILVLQTKKPVDIAKSQLELKFKNRLSLATRDKMRRYITDEPILVVNLPKLSDEQLCGLTTSPCLLGMKHIWHLSTKIVAKIFHSCYALSTENRKSLSAKLISYLGLADGRYDRKRLSAIEADCFPDLPDEERIMSSIEFGFEGARLEGIEQGKKQGIRQGIEQGMQQGVKQGMQQGIEKGREGVIISMLKYGKLEDSAICQLANITEEQLAEIKNKIAKH